MSTQNRALSAALKMAGTQVNMAKRLGCSKARLNYQVKRGYLSSDLGIKAARAYDLDLIKLITPPRRSKRAANGGG